MAYEPPPGYSDEVKRNYLKYTNGMGFRAIKWVIGVHPTIVIYWVTFFAPVVRFKVQLNR